MNLLRFLSLVFMLFIFEFSCSKNNREINVEQLQHRGDGLYYAINEEKPYSGKVFELYKNGQKSTERTFKNGKLHGLSSTWDSKGQKKSEVSYKNSEQTGPFRTWYANGQQEKAGAYKDGRLQGRLNLWTKDGEKIETGIVTDIDGNTYPTVKFDDQWWMVNNLRVTRYRNGNSIPNVTYGNAWSNLKTSAYCDYGNRPENAITYGHLYNWYAVNNPRDLAPEGWHVPSDAEWQKLVDYLGGSSVAGGKMKEAGMLHWNNPNTGATNESGFSGLPGGYRANDGRYISMGYHGSFWSATEDNSSGAWSFYLGYDYSVISLLYSYKPSGFSVRCVRD